MRVYFDTCVVIYQVECVPPWAAQVDALSAQHTPFIVVSDLVRMECLIGPLKKHNPQLRELFSGFFDQVEVVGLLAAVFDLAAELRATCSLETADALHAACAIHHGCEEIGTNDNDLSALGGRLRTRVVG